MKRSVILCMLAAFLLAFSVAVYAQNNSGNVGNLTAGLRGAGEDLMDREVNLPSWLEMPARILFGIEQGISWQKLIILLGVWIMMFIIILQIISFVPFLENKIISSLVALIITCLISITGAANKLAIFFWDLSDFLTWLSESSALKIFVSLLAFLILIFIAVKFKKMIRKKMVIGKAEGLGMKAGAQMKIEAEKFEHGSGI